jgi:hypothetical protein
VFEGNGRNGVWFLNYDMWPNERLCCFLLIYAHMLLGMAIRVWVPDPMVTGTRIIFYLWVALVSDPNQDGYGMGIFFHPRVTRRVPDTLLPL